MAASPENSERLLLPWVRRKPSPGQQEELLPDDVRNAKIYVVEEERPLFERHADSDHPSSGIHDEAVYLRDHGFTATVHELAKGTGKPERHVFRHVVNMKGVLKVTGTNGETPNLLQSVARKPQHPNR